MKSQGVPIREPSHADTAPTIARRIKVRRPLVLSLSSFRFRFSRSVPTRAPISSAIAKSRSVVHSIECPPKGNSPHLPRQSYFMPGVMIR